MARIKIDKDKCKGCMLCVVVCPRKLIAPSKKLNKLGMRYAEIVKKEGCTGCTLCAIMCPDVRIEVYK